MKLALKKLLQANPSIQVSTLLSGSLSTPSAKQPFDETTFQLIESQSMNGSSTITFNSIPQTYTHLQVRAVFNKGASGTPQMYMRVNGNTGNNYTGYEYGHYYSGSNILRSWGGGTSGSALYGPGFWGSLFTGNDAGHWILNISDYTNSTSRKQVVSVPAQIAGNTQYEYFLHTGFFNSNNAITSLTFFSSGGESLGAGSRVSIYGVKSA